MMNLRADGGDLEWCAFAPANVGAEGWTGMMQSCECGRRRPAPLLVLLMALVLGPVLALAPAALPGLSGRAFAEGRVALVIGNSAYAHVPSLPNPSHDAQDVADALGRLGFAVKTVTDADFDRMRRSLVEFGRAAQGAEMAVLYFAGHGIEIDGNNWLLPTDVELKYDADAGTEAIGLPLAIQAVTGAKTLGLVILDACRNNPFKSSMRKTNQGRSVQILGLAPVEPVSNVLVAYAARDGTVANDGTGRNSPYTAALLNHLETPGLEIDFLFRNVRDDVMAATDNEQQPFAYGSLSSEEIYFKPPPAVDVATDDAPTPDAAEVAWSFLQATNDVLTLARFVERFPTSSRVADARMRITSLTTVSLRAAGDDLPLPARPVVFADTDFERAEKAVARRFMREVPAVDAAWAVVKDTRDHTLIRRFVDRFPGQKRQIEADIRLAALGQKPVTVHAAPRGPLEVDEAVLVQAAADPDVNQCFRRNDQTDDKCRRAFERFPDISRFVEDIRFTIPFCHGMGSPGGCLPTVKAAWNFPGTKSGNGGKGGNAVGIGPAGPGISSPGSADLGTPGSGGGGSGPSGQPGNRQGNQPNDPHGKDVKGPKGVAPRHHGVGSHVSATDMKTTDVKTHGIKTDVVKLPKSPAVNTSAVKTPNVRVNPPNVRINVRVPNVDIRVR
jgi:hypothetical protein